MDKGEKEGLDKAKVVLLGDDEDILHAGYSFTLKHEGKRFPSVLHYVYAKVLQHFQLHDEAILDIVSTPVLEVVGKAYKLLESHLNPGADKSRFLLLVRQTVSYHLLQGLKIRSEQDENFRNNLTGTNDALLIVCDEKDPELGVGMNDKTFYEFWTANGYKLQDLSDWMLTESRRPPSVGQNMLGCMLMVIRHELREADRLKYLKNPEFTFEGLSTVQEDHMTITANSQILSLSGVLKPLSNYYKSDFEVKEKTYQSVEHYAYERLFESLKIDEIYVHQLHSVPYPVDVQRVALKILETIEHEKPEWRNKMAKLDRYRQTAMKHKISKNAELRQFLLNTGKAFLVETNPYGDDVWTVNTDEYEIQHLLTKPGIDILHLVNIMCHRIDPPPTLTHIGQNKTGILLMELRQKYANTSFSPYPFIAPPDMNIQRLGLTNNVICFTPESIFHPFYPVPITVTSTLTVPSPIHYVVMYSCRFLGMKPSLEEELISTTDSYECWSRFNSFLQTEVNLPFEKLKNYFMAERQRLLKIALSLMFQQHSAILRSLLETEDALLVYCARFSTIEYELSSGLRERDFRRVFQETQSDIRELIEFFLKPQAYRPPYIGGNRLGMILMELRRQFTRGGCYPSEYEVLPMALEAKLGTDSPTENYVCDKPFTALKLINFTSVWADPLILSTKDTPGYQKIRRGFPLFIRENDQLAHIVVKDCETDNENLKKSAKGTGPGIAYSAAVQVSKHVNDLLVSGERKTISLKHQVECITSLNDDPDRSPRRESEPVPPMAPQLPPNMPLQPQLPQPPMSLPPVHIPPPHLPPPQMQLQPPPQRFYPPLPMPPNQQTFYPLPQQQRQQQRNDYRNNDNRFGSNNFRDRRGGSGRDDERNNSNRRQYSNSPSRNQTRNYNNYRGPPQLQQQQREQRNYSPARDQDRDQQQRSSENEKRRPPPSSPKSKKAKRVVEEADLSEGEIVSSDED